jgi:hypothetical protein
MSSVPLSMQQLEDITTEVAQELIEDWAINDRFNEDNIVEATQNAVSDTIFVINLFMEKFNTLMVQQDNNKLIN